MLQTYGKISLGDIGVEFKGQKPYRLGEYYGKDGVPATGPISLSDFYGRSNYVIILNLDHKTFSVYAGETTTVSYTSILTGLYDTKRENNALAVVGVADDVNGIATVHETYINFKSTAEVGEQAGFAVRLMDLSGYIRTFNIVMNVLEKPIKNPGEYSESCLIDYELGINAMKGYKPGVICEVITGSEGEMDFLYTKLL